MGKKDEALKALKLAVDQGFAKLDGIENNDVFDSLRSDKRWATIIDRATKNYERETGKPLAATKAAKAAKAAKPVKPSEKEVREKQVAELKTRCDREIAQKDYQAAAKTCRELLTLLPNDGGTLYNLACVQARLKQNTEAIATLAEAIEHGYADSDHMKEDEDLVTLRDDAKFKQLLDKAHKNERTAYAKWYRAGKEIAGVKTLEDYPQDGLRYRLRMSPDATTEKPNKLIVWLHPSAGQNSRGMNDTVEAMAPMFLKHGYALVVFTQKNYMGWNDSDGKKLFATLEKIGQIPGIDAKKPILFGYSAGGQMALELFMKDASLLGGMVLDAAYPIKRTPKGVVPCFTPPTQPGDAHQERAHPRACWRGRRWLHDLETGQSELESGRRAAGAHLCPGEEARVALRRPAHQAIGTVALPRSRQRTARKNRRRHFRRCGGCGRARCLRGPADGKKRIALGVRLNDEAVIVSVMENSGAARAGLQTGDTILRVGRPADQTARGHCRGTGQ